MHRFVWAKPTPVCFSCSCDWLAGTVRCMNLTDESSGPTAPHPPPPLIPALNDTAQQTARACYAFRPRRAYCDHLSASEQGSGALSVLKRREGSCRAASEIRAPGDSCKDLRWAIRPNGKLRISTVGRRGSVSGHVGSTPAREHRDAREDGGVNGSKFFQKRLQSKSGIGGFTPVSVSLRLA